MSWLHAQISKTINLKRIPSQKNKIIKMVSLTNRKNLIGHAHYLQKHFPQVMFCKPAEPAHTSSQGSTGMDPVMKSKLQN